MGSSLSFPWSGNAGTLAPLRSSVIFIKYKVLPLLWFTESSERTLVVLLGLRWCCFQGYVLCISDVAFVTGMANRLQAAKQSLRKSIEEVFPTIKAKPSPRSFKSFHLNRKTIKTPLPPVLHRTVCSHWPGITFPFPTGGALLSAAPYGSTPLDGSMQPAELLT